MVAKSNIASLPAKADHSDDHELSIYREVFDSMEQGIIVWSADGVCTLVNQRYYEVTGSSKAHLYPGYTWESHLKRLTTLGQYSNEQALELNKNMASGEIFSIERESVKGTTVSLVIRPLRNGGHVVSVTDITRKKSDEDQHLKALKRAELAEADAQTALTEQQQRQTEVDQISEFGDWLHSCKSLAELYEIVKQAMQSLYPESSGQLFIYSNSRDVLDGVCSWNDENVIGNIQAQDCWSLRRGRAFQFGEGMIHLHCNHVQADSHSHIQDDQEEHHYVCLPLLANGDTIGLLHIDFSQCQAPGQQDNKQTFNLPFAKRCAEQISLAIANAQLRDELHEQSTRDSLTGLFNRRYFLERCRSEASRANQQGEDFGLAVFDADDFKDFNDHYGHDAGDAVLCHIADIAHKHFVNDDVISRIGGEEFAVLSPNTDSAEFHERLEEFRDLVASMSVRYYNKPLPAVTISIGYVNSAEHGNKISDLIRLADGAMYRSKDTGKNCISKGVIPTH